MEEQIAKTIEAIRQDKVLFASDEASIKTGIILRLLRQLGWDPFDVSEVVPEYTLEGRRVDFALRLLGANKVFVEAKRPREDLTHHQQQLLEYSFTAGVRLAVLTNGATWWLYLPLGEGSWEQRRFYALDLFEQAPLDIARRLVEFLAKGRVASGDAVLSAEQVYRSSQRQALLRNAIPRAWVKLVEEPDDALVDLIGETAERLCGLRPEPGDVALFLANLARAVPGNPVAQAVPSRLPTRSPSIVSPRPSIDGSFIGKKLESFTLFGKSHSPRNWQQLLLIVGAELFARHPVEFDRCLALRGSRWPYFSTNPNELHDPKPIDQSPYYAETKLNSNSIVARSREMLSLFGHDGRELQIVAS